jgi:hypothetical protein
VGELLALLTTLTLAVAAAAAVGPKVTQIVQLADTERIVGQSLASAKEAGFEPVKVIDVSVNALVLLFVSVIVCIAADVPTG